MYKVHLRIRKDRLIINFNQYLCEGVYKIRSIGRYEWIGDTCLLVGNDYTNFIQIPDWMTSYKEFTWEEIPRPKGGSLLNSQKILSTVVKENNLRVTSLK